jgi:hypothetical protein
VFPYLSYGVVTQYGLFQPGLFLPGRSEALLPVTLCRLVTAAALGLLFILFVHAPTRTELEDPDAMENPEKTPLPWAVKFIPLGSAIAYGLILIGRAKEGSVFDRYALPLLPLFALGILAAWQDRGLRRPGPLAWAVLLVFGTYGVAITHDHFEQMRARALAIQLMEEKGVAREQILGGFEDDMWTQVALDGKVNGDEKLDPAPDASHPDVPPYLRMWYLRLTPRIKPHYFLATSNIPGTVVCRFDAVEYSAWLPPVDRQLLILCP